MPATPSNLILIQTDDQRFDTIAALGGQDIETPHLDRLARSGTAFTQAYNMGSMHVAVCMPSRNMLLTGRDLFSLEGFGQFISPAHTSLPEVLRHQGYLTCHIGKWHHDPAAHTRLFSTARKIFGFRDLGWYEGCNGHWHTPVFDHDPSGRYSPENAYHDPPLGPFTPPFETTRSGGRHSAEVFTDAAVDFLEERRRDRDRRPFFLYLAHLTPHDPRQYPAALAARYHPGTVTLPPNFAPRHPFDNGEMYVRDELLEGQPRRPQAIRQMLADYRASIAHLDAQIGRLLDAVQNSGFAENTLLVFTSDHGLAGGSHGLIGNRTSTSTASAFPCSWPARESRRTSPVPGSVTSSISSPPSATCSLSPALLPSRVVPFPTSCTPPVGPIARCFISPTAASSGPFAGGPSN